MGGYDRYAHGANTYDAGDYYLICDVCGFKVRRSDARKRWDNAIVCPEDWEIKHPQEELKSVREKIHVDDPRSEPSPTFISTPITQDDL